MKKINLTVIAIVIAAFLISMFAFQPITSEASNNVAPSANPTPRKKTIKRNRNGQLIDTSTGEIVWLSSRKSSRTTVKPRLRKRTLRKVKGYEFGDTATHERKRKRRN